MMIDTIVCITSDDEFLRAFIKSLLPISDNILFLYTDYFLGGEPQDKEILNKIKSYKNIYKSLHFLKYEIDFNQKVIILMDLSMLEALLDIKKEKKGWSI